MRQTPPVTAEIDGVLPSIASAEESLVARARQGDRGAFAELIEPRASRLLRMARVIVGNETDALEVAQETLIAAWVRLPGLRDSQRFDAWLNRTLVNKCRDALRRRRRVREIDIGEADLTVPDTAEGVAAQASVLAAFDRLSVDDRHILAMRHVHDLPLDAIARQLDIPVGTAKSRLWSARRALERALEAEA